VKSVGVGTRVRMVFSDVSAGIALPQWTIDEPRNSLTSLALRVE